MIVFQRTRSCRVTRTRVPRRRSCRSVWGAVLIVSLWLDALVS